MIRSSSPKRLAAMQAVRTHALMMIQQSLLVSHGCAVVAWISRAQPVTSCRVDSNGVDQPDMSDAASGMAASIQCSLQAVRKRALHINTIRNPLMMKARSIDGCLRFHTQAHPVQDAEERSRNNSRTARRTCHETEFAVAEQNRRRHGAQRTMAGRDGIGLRLH